MSERCWGAAVSFRVDHIDEEVTRRSLCRWWAELAELQEGEPTYRTRCVSVDLWLNYCSITSCVPRSGARAQPVPHPRGHLTTSPCHDSPTHSVRAKRLDAASRLQVLLAVYNEFPHPKAITPFFFAASILRTGGSRCIASGRATVLCCALHESTPEEVPHRVRTLPTLSSVRACVGPPGFHLCVWVSLHSHQSKRALTGCGGYA